MDERLPDFSEETMLQALNRRYASLTAWLLRFDRMPDQGRLPEPTRTESKARMNTPSRQPHPPRPT
jgi:hypothetical protein